MMSGKKVAIVMGSASDLPTMDEAAKILGELRVGYEIRVISAHRSPDDAARFAKSARRKGFRCVIAGAGGAAHLAGVIASHTTLPVIGVPMETRELKGVDSLFSTVQMPAGVPVACVAIGISGAKNAAILAVEILSLSDKRLEKALDRYKRELTDGVRRKDREIQNKQDAQELRKFAKAVARS